MGLTVPPRDPRALAEGICNVLSHPEAYVQHQAQIAEQFSPVNVAARYERLFERLLE